MCSETYIGTVDTGIPETPENHSIVVSGWALDSEGNSFESITLKCGEDRYDAQLGIPRPDVREVYQDYSDSGISGYVVEVSLPTQCGKYKAVLAATTKSAKQLVLSEFDFEVLLKPIIVSLETPNTETNQNGRIRFSGWCCHPQYRVLELTVNIGEEPHICNYGLERSDVAAIYPNWPGSEFCGFEAVISLAHGSYSLQFDALLDNGKIVSLPIVKLLTIRGPAFWSIALHKIISAHHFVRFSLAHARLWYKTRGRFPALAEVPNLARKAYHVFQQSRGNKSGESAIPRGFRLPEKEDLYTSWLRQNHWNERREKELTSKLASFSQLPLISVLMPVYNPPLSFLEQAIESVKKQVYDNWELCIADDFSNDADVRDYLTVVAASDSRIKVMFRDVNGNISQATNSAAELATGEFIAFLDNDDVLTPNALGEVALYIMEHPDSDFLYSDDDKIDEKGKRFAPQFKPDWSPELLLSYMYLSHLCIVRRSLFTKIGGIRIGFEGSQDYDFALRATEHARHVGHIPLVLYHWRATIGSTAQSGDAKPESHTAGLRAIQEALERRHIDANVLHPSWAKKDGLGIFSITFPIRGPSVTIIIPTKNSFDILRTCINSLERTNYGDYKILIIDNESDDPEILSYFQNCSHRVLRIANPSEGFNYSYLNNCAVDACDSEYVLFLNNDTEITNPSWLSEMMGYAQLEGVGAVGARLLYPDSRVQHAGIVHGYYKGMAGPAHKLLPNWNNGYLSYAAVSRNYSAVTAACLLMSRQLFIEIGGFDEAKFGVAYNDVDLCYRLVDKGYRCVYSAGSILKHYEGHTRGFCDKPDEEAAFKNKYRYRVDKYYNPNLSLENERFDILPRASYLRFPSQPMRALMIAFNLNLEGAPYSQYELTVGLKNMGVIDPVVYCPEDGPLRELYEKAGIEVIVRPHPLLGVFSIESYENSISLFAEMIRMLSVEIVYGNTLQTFYAIDAAKSLDLPSIWNPRESEPWQTYFSHYGEKIAIKALHCFTYPYKVIFVSDATRNGCESLNSSNNFVTIHNGLETRRAENEWEANPRQEIRVELDIGENEIVVLLLGTVCERKGQIDLVNAIKKLQLSESLSQLRFYIVGDRKSAYSAQLHRAIESLPEIIRERVTVVEETKKAAKYFSAADIFVCSSRVESYPRVILEAMYYRLPIITTPVFGISEQLTNGTSTLFYQPGDVDQLAEYIDRLATDVNLREQLAKYAKLRFEYLTNYEEMLGKYAEYFVGAYYSKKDLANITKNNRYTSLSNAVAQN